jgi:hypothetical protein
MASLVHEAYPTGIERLADARRAYRRAVRGAPLRRSRLEDEVARHMRPAVPVLLLCGALLPALVATRAQPQRDGEPQGLTGCVLAPDGTPVSGGRAMAQSVRST